MFRHVVGHPFAHNVRENMRGVTWLCIWVLMCVATMAHAQDIYAPLLEDAQLKNASFGVCIVDVDTRQVVVSYNAERALVPASVLKAVTAATVMKCYDDEARKYTQVGYTGEVVDSVLHGDIVVQGVADPSLSHKRSRQSSHLLLDEIVDSVRRIGIKKIAGNILVDASSCRPDGYSDWMLEDAGFYYGAPCQGVNYKGNSYALPMRTGAMGTQPHILSLSSEITVERYYNHLIVGERDSSFVMSHPYATEALLMGIVPAHRDSFVLQCAMPDPPLTLARDITASLQLDGVEVDGKPLTDRLCREQGYKLPRATTTLYNHPSDSLREMLRIMMWYSDNLYAESLLRWVALSTDSIADIRRAVDAQYKIWQSEGLDMSQINVRDGSGLSRKNSVTSQFLASFLVNAYHDKQLGSRYLSLYPIAGKDATVRSFMSRQPLSGELRVKSGSMSGVLCYVGYYTLGNKTYAVVLMGNNFSCRNAHVRGCYERFLHRVFDTMQ